MQDSLSFEKARQNKTSVAHRKFKPFQTFNTNNSMLGQLRPFTTSIGRNNNLYSYRNMQNAEEELSQTCKEQMSVFVSRKIKNLTRKYNQKIPLSEEANLNSTILSSEDSKIYNSQPKNIRQMHLSGLSYSSRCRMESVLGEPYFVNARQKLMRMLARKRENQLKYQTLQSRVKQVQKQRLIAKRIKDKQFKNPQPIVKSQWDNEWRDNNSKEVARYKTRLSLKHRKKDAGVTIQW